MDRTTRSTEFGRFTEHVTPGAYALGIRMVIALEELRAGIEKTGQTFSVYAAQQSDPKVIARILEALPPVALCALEVLVECAGRAPTYVVEREVAERTKASPTLIQHAVHQAARHTLLVETRGRESACYLIDRSAEAVARGVFGISLPVAPTNLTPPSRKSSEAHRIAALAYLAHRAARPTVSRSILHVTVKSIAKAVGADAKILGAWYESALSCGLLASRGTTVAPIFARLVAEGDSATRAPDPRALVAAWIPANEWVSLEALARAECSWDARTAIEDRDTYQMVESVSDTRREVERQLAQCENIDKVVQEGVIFYRRAPSSSGTGRDGYVNPSFEVIVGPECPLSSVAAIALGCELKRLDHFMTFALTPMSIANGASCGLTELALREALAVASKHPIPDNVDRSITDWFKRDTAFELEDAIVVTGPSVMISLLEKGVDATRIKRLGPEALAFDRSTPRRLIETAIEKAKGVLRCEADTGEAAMRKADREELEEMSAPIAPSLERAAPALSFQGRPALRERFLRDIREKLALSKADVAAQANSAVRQHAAPIPRTSGPRPCPECGKFHAEDEDDDVEEDELDELEETLTIIVARSAPDLSTILRRLAPAGKSFVAALPAALLLRFLCLSAKGRKKVVERSHSPDQFLSTLRVTETYSNDAAWLIAKEDDIDPAFLGLLLGELGIDWHGPIPSPNTSPPPTTNLKQAPPSVPAATPPPAPPPTVEEEAPRGAIRGKGPLDTWLRRRVRGDVAWLDLQTTEGAMRGVFTIDAVQKRGKEIALLVSADWLDRGRVVFEREILGAADVV